LTINNDQLRTTVTAALRLQQLLSAVADAQWQPSVTPTPREDTTERSKGGHNDPTSAVVSDDRRLALRAAVVKAEHTLEAFAGSLGFAARDLQKALAQWEGE
jgi:hypothetical protein